MDQSAELGPVRESVSRSSVEGCVGVVVVVVAALFGDVIELIPEVYPPVLSGASEEGGREHYHEHWVLHVVALERFEVGFAVS